MLTPRQIDQLTEQVAYRYDELQDMLLKEISRKLRKGLDIGASIQWDIQKLLELGPGYRPQVERLIMRETSMSEAAVKKYFKKAGHDAIENDNKLLPDGHKLSKEMSTMQRRIIEAGIRNVNGQLHNMVNVMQGSTLELYGDLMSKGYSMVSSGAFTTDQAMQKIGRELVMRGVSGALYASGRHDKLEVAMRRAFRTSLNQTMLRLSEQNAEELDAEYVEVTAHAGARPEHALWQGKVYSLHGDRGKYKDLRAATGYGTITGLGGVNCRHSFYPFFPEATKPGYTASQLRAMDGEAVRFKGQRISLYEAEQQMRGYERKMRELERLQEFADTNTAAKRRALREVMKTFSKQTGIPIDPARYRIYGAG